MERANDQIDSTAATRIVEVDGRQLRVSVREGADGRPPLLLLNGLGVHIEGLQPFVDALSPDRGVIRFDVPGIGQSPASNVPYLLCQMARLTSRLLDELNAPVVDVLGVSWGGALTQQLAFQDRKRVRRLVMVSTAAGVLIPGKPKIVREMLTRRRFDDKEHASKIAAELYGGKARTGTSKPALLNHMKNGPSGVLHQQLALLGWTSLPFARFVRQPALVLTGDDDPIIPPANGKLLKALYPNARLHIFRDGHLGLITSADDIAPIVEDFLDQP